MAMRGRRLIPGAIAAKPVKKTRTLPKLRSQDVGTAHLLAGAYDADVVPLERRASADLLPDLNPSEREFFTLVSSGQAPEVSQFLDSRLIFNMNCQNYQGYTALVLAVKHEDAQMVFLLLQYKGIVLGDALLHAAQTGNCVIVDMLLNHQELHHEDHRGVPESSDFSADLTPIIVAAHNEHYEVIKYLLSRGYFVERPHPPYCSCVERCKNEEPESLSNSRGKYNAYRALASPSYIAHSSADPVLTAFQLAHELKLASCTEPEFKIEYRRLREQCQEFAVSLLDQCRTTDEVKTMLNRSEGGHKEDLKFARVTLAINLDQRSFVAHPNCQQVLRGCWLEGWQDWKRFSLVHKLIHFVPRVLLLPLMSLVYLIAPDSKLAKPWRSPLNKFFSFVASYVLFLVVILVQNGIDTMDSSRGPPNTGLEWFIILYVWGFAWRCVKQAWGLGFKQYTAQNWNLYDVLMVLIFLLAFLSWAWAAADILQEDRTLLPRKYWNNHDPTLIGEAFYAVAIIFAFGKVTYFFQTGHHLGPFQVSMGRMFADIVNFLVVFMVVMLSFAVGMNKLYHHYKGQVRKVGGVTVRQSDAFNTIPQSIATLYWAIYGYSPPYFANVVISEHYVKIGDKTRVTVNQHVLTEFVGHTLFALYYITGIIILVNMLIAMMSTSFSNVQENADTEWKFARTRVWLGFFESSPGTLPPPFNLIPSPKIIKKIFVQLYNVFIAQTTDSFWPEKPDAKDMQNDEEYEVLMSRLVQRYLSFQHRQQLTHPLTEIDLHNIQSQVKDLRRQNLQVVQEDIEPETDSTPLAAHHTTSC